MLAYEIIGYLHKAAAYCVDCAYEGHGIDDDTEDPEWHPIFPTTEFDNCPSCDECGEDIEHVSLLSPR